MKPRLIQTSKVLDDNKAEKAFLEFLTQLPESYTVYRELKLNRAYADRVKGMEKAQPDFVVVGPAVGLLAIETKDWNLNTNLYTWRDQTKVLKQQVGSNVIEELDNPAHQADVYLHAFIELVRDTGVFVSSIVAFPRLSRQQFLNKIADIVVLKQPMTKFLLDLETTIFKEDVDEFFLEPEKLLRAIVRKRSAFRLPEEAQLHAVHERILPSSFRIGNADKRQDARKQLRMITEQQEKWIFDLSRPQSYLLDVAGSGKTNVLVSRAIHLIDRAHKQRQTPPEILLTTYNPNLQVNIEHILSGKISPDTRYERYRTLYVENVEALMQHVAAAAYGYASVADYHALNDPRSGESYGKTLRDDVRTALREEPDRFRKYDYIFIDEIQDFDDAQLDLIHRLARIDNFFFVGDIGQKLYDRYHDLHRHGFVIEELDLPSSYKMYRTPRYIGELAFRFVMADSVIHDEFKQRGYRENTRFEALSDNAAELLRATDPVSTVVGRINDLLAGQYTEDDLMVVASAQALPAYRAAFERVGFRFSEGQPRQNGHIALLDFMNVKGLQRVVVIISHIEDLYHRSKSDGMFDDMATQQKKERFSRRKVYVALTRTTEECVIYYSDPANPFVSDLLRVNRQIASKR